MGPNRGNHYWKILFGMLFLVIILAGQTRLLIQKAQVDVGDLEKKMEKYVEMEVAYAQMAERMASLDAKMVQLHVKTLSEVTNLVEGTKELIKIQKELRQKEKLTLN